MFNEILLAKTRQFLEFFLKCCSSSVYIKTSIIACSFDSSVFSAVNWSYWYNQHSLLRTNHKVFVSLCSFGVPGGTSAIQTHLLQAPFSDCLIGNQGKLLKLYNSSLG